MAADLARITYDPLRQYRSVVMQQGRVTLEADANEASVIAAEALRLETIDLVGPTGTPDDGFKVNTGSGPGGVTVGPGTLYLGGWRLHLDQPLDLATQPDWLDAPAFTTATGNLLVALLLTEQSVGAVEDVALREVALGGPDSAARTRLTRQFLRLATDGVTCAAGAASVGKLLAGDGVTLDPATLQIVSAATLQAAFVAGPSNTDPCTPAAAGGYLGADNQLVRVTVLDYDPVKKTGTLLWGWNNASMLYRAKADTQLTLVLSGTPVDEEHAPQAGQAVEILRSQAALGGDSFIAEPQGVVTILTDGYSFDTGRIGVTDKLSDDLQKATTPLFVRLWQAKVPFTAGQPTALDGTSGITVTVSLPALPSAIALRPFWHFAVRPLTPVQIHPRRYFDAPQPPDGPRQWLTDLAVVAAQASGSKPLADCRVPFVPLTKLGGKCCCLVLGPNEVAGRGGLQAVLDGLAGTKGGVSLLPGTYALPAPVVLGPQHAGLTLQACGPGAELTAGAADLSPFAFGLIVVAGAPDITLRGLTFRMPMAPLGAANAGTVQPTASVGVLVGAAARLQVEGCSFLAVLANPYVFGGGLSVFGACPGLVVRRNSFVAQRFVAGASLFGVLATVANSYTTTVLTDAEISENVFQSLTAGVVAYAQFGLLRCLGNRVSDCGTGLFFAASNLGASTEVARQALADTTHNAALSQAVVAGLQAPVLADIATRAAAFVPKLPPAPAAPTVSDTARQALLADHAARGAAAWTSLVGVSAAPAPATPATATGVATPAMMQSATLMATGPLAVGVASTGPAATVAGVATAAGTTAAATTTAAGTTATAGAAATVGQALLPAADALKQVQQLSLTVILAGDGPNPVLHITGNDVVLTATGTTAGVGIAVGLPLRNDAGTVLLTANRVTTADTRTAAASLVFPSLAAATGNVLVQGGVRTDAASPALILVGDVGTEFEVAANVVHRGAIILPARATSAPTTSWNFLNTVG